MFILTIFLLYMLYIYIIGLKKNKFFLLINMAWYKGVYFPQSIKNIMFHFQILSVKYHFGSAILGFFVLLIITSQLLSGVILAFSLLPESMLIPIIRDEEDLEDLYTDDFFWIHERGVDLVFVFSYLHLFRKIYLNITYFEQEFAWKSGAFSFIVFQAVTFLGLILCCTHLSDITLTIAANIISTFILFGKAYWWIFTDKTLNTDTLLRLAYAHYIVAFYLFFLSFIHALDMHYDWKNDINVDGIDTELFWFDEAFTNEISIFFDWMVFVFFIGLYLFNEPEALSYEIFMWGDVGAIVDVRFSGIAPHWYFRPFQAWLIVCPYHKTGVFGIIYYMWVIFHQNILNGNSELEDFFKNKKQNDFFKKYNYIYFDRHLSIDITLFNQIIFYFFLMSMLYVTTFLPYGKFYNPVGGNIGMLFSYLYILLYLTFSNLKNFFFNIFFFNKFNNNIKYICV